MNTRIAAIAAAAVLVVLLTGCGAAAPAASAPATTDAGAQQVQETPEPLVAETQTPDADSSDAAFLTGVRDNLPPKTTIANATDEQLLAAGAEACDRIAAGESTEAMSLIEGEQPWDNGTYYDSAAIIISARAHLCAG